MKSTQGRTFFTTALIFLLALLVLGMSMQLLVRDYLTDAAFEKLDNNSEALSRLAASYYADGSLSSMQFLMNLDLIATVSDMDAVICGSSGQIVICSDFAEGCNHQELTLNQDYMNQIAKKGILHETRVLQGLFSGVRYVTARPIYENGSGQVIGYMLVSSPITETQTVLHRISSIFSLGSIVVLLISVIAMAYFSKRQSSPLLEMARKARAFGHGDLDARVKINGNEPREVEELAIAFNNMASSLQKMEYSRQEFVANVSHELKTPMTTIGGYVDGILDGTIPPEKQRYYMEIVSTETKRLSRLVRSMLDISQLQSEGGIPSDKMSRFDVEECAGKMLITFEKKILDKNLQVDVDMPEHPCYTVAQEDYISQVIYNLLDNAVKFCPQGGTLTLRVREDGSKIYVTVGNDGETIPPEELPLLFDRFHKIDKSRSQNRDGWGLGLYIVKTIIGLHGEDITATSIDGKTEFTFTLPLTS